MNAPSPHRVVISGDPGSYRVTTLPAGITCEARRFADALRLGEARARERSCVLVNDTAYKPVSGDAGPIHLLGSPIIFVVDEGDAWAVVVMSPPWGFGPCGQSFVGPNAARAADRYGRELFDQFRQMAIAEQARRDRIKQLKRAAVPNIQHYEKESGR